MIAFGSELGWSLVFLRRLLVGMVLGALIGYPLVYSINILLRFERVNSLGSL